MPRCDEHGHYESRCPDCAQAFGHDDCEDTIAELRADVERLARELREARAAIRALDLLTPWLDADKDAVYDHHAPAIRAAEGGT